MSELLTSEDLAEVLGVTVGTIRSYRSRGVLPEPDEMVGRTPTWRRRTIEQWRATRPGQGARTDRAHGR